MKPVLDLSLCFRDSPDYRLDVQKAESVVWQLEQLCKSVVKASKHQQDTGQGWLVESSLQRFAETLKEIERSRKLMLSQLKDVFMEPVDSFVKKDIMQVRESKKTYEKSSDQLDTSLDRYLSVRVPVNSIGNGPNSNPSAAAATTTTAASKDLNRIQEAAEDVSQQRREFHEKSVQYAVNLNEFNHRKRADFLENVLALMYTQFAFFHQGYELLKDMEPTMKDLTVRLKELRQQYDDDVAAKLAETQKSVLENAEPYYSPLPSDQRPPALPPAAGKSGYLMKKGSGKITQVWSRRWFSLRSDYLIYSTRGKDEAPTIAANLRLATYGPGVDEAPTIAANLRLATVKLHENPDRRFCFEVVSPVKSYVLQAESEQEMKEWIECLQDAIGRALNSEQTLDVVGKGLVHGSKEKLDENDDRGITIGVEKFRNSSISGTSNLRDSVAISAANAPANSIRRQDSKNSLVMERLKKIPGNDKCADCQTENPDWVSINLGVVICIDCSGIHRSLGVQISKVRSLKLDKLEPEIIDIMAALGNQTVNRIFESGYSLESDEILKPNPKSDRTEKEKWIHAKYVHKKFLTPIPEETDLNNILCEAIKHANFEAALAAIIGGASVNYKNENSSGKTPLMMSIENLSDASIQFLLQWNADIHLADNNGNTAIHYAVMTGQEKYIKLLLKRNAVCDAKNNDGKTPVDLAVDRSDAGIATTLRLHMFELEQNQPAKRAQISVEPSSISDSDTSMNADSSRNINSPPETGLTGRNSSLNHLAAVSSGPSRSTSAQQFRSDEQENGSKISPNATSPTGSARANLSASIANASAMAGSAAAYANKFIKSSFSKMQNDSGSKETSPTKDDSQPEGKKSSILMSFRSGPKYEANENRRTTSRNNWRQ
ncbi:hypothetical protein MP638_000250 [Amoeboaphelidium occidentale]|nr:hypothetical protein MP638_000250 [Amoeboaphelidium occidentale]